jgi:hypothetical protein
VRANGLAPRTGLIISENFEMPKFELKFEHTNGIQKLQNWVLWKEDFESNTVV